MRSDLAPSPTRTSATSCIGPCTFHFPAPDNLGFVSVRLVQSISKGQCLGFSCQTDIVYVVPVKMCAGPGGSSGAYLETGSFSLALSNETQAPLDSETDDPNSPTAFGSVNTVAPNQCVTGDLYFDVTSHARWTSLNFDYSPPVGSGADIVYVWKP